MTAPRPSASELLPCPFCGGEAERVDIDDGETNFGGSCICCKQCGASSPVHFDRKENLIASWNDRVNSAALAVVAEQAADERLWFIPVYITEAYLQKELRRLHAAIESKSPDECALATLRTVLT